MLDSLMFVADLSKRERNLISLPAAIEARNSCEKRSSTEVPGTAESFAGFDLGPNIAIMNSKAFSNFSERICRWTRLLQPDRLTNKHKVISPGVNPLISNSLLDSNVFSSTMICNTQVRGSLSKIVERG